MTAELLNKRDKTKHKRYFFDSLIFDEEDEEEIEEEELPPPPPTYSEEELEAAKKTAFEEGRKKGFEESEEARSVYIAQLLEKLIEGTAPLFDSEDRRDSLFEKEVIHLCLSIFQKLFPVYQTNHGLEEMKAILLDILNRQKGHKKIKISLHPDRAEQLEELISHLDKREDMTRYVVHADPDIGENNFLMDWENGGAIGKIDDMAAEIETVLKQMLADNKTKSHDSLMDLEAHDGVKSPQLANEKNRDSNTPDNQDAEKEVPDE